MGEETIGSERGKYIINQKNSLIGNLVDIFRYFLPSFLVLSIVSVLGAESSSSPIKSVMTTKRERYRTHVKHLREPGSTLGSRQRWCGGRGNEALKDTLRYLQGATLWRGEREGSRIFLDKYPVFSCSSIFSLFHKKKGNDESLYFIYLMCLGWRYHFRYCKKIRFLSCWERKRKRRWNVFSLYVNSLWLLMLN